MSGLGRDSVLPRDEFCIDESYLEDGPSGALCLPCVIGFTAEMDDPGRMGTAQ